MTLEDAVLWAAIIIMIPLAVVFAFMVLVWPLWQPDRHRSGHVAFAAVAWGMAILVCIIYVVGNLI